MTIKKVYVKPQLKDLGLLMGFKDTGGSGPG